MKDRNSSAGTPKSRRGNKPAFPGSAAAASVAGAASPADIQIRPVTDPIILDRGRVFSEALRQTKPLAASGTREAGQAAKAILEGTARPRGLHPDTARRLATGSIELGDLTSGANPTGKAAEVVVLSDIRELHAGSDTRMVNAPGRAPSNFEDIRLSPDGASRKDFLVRFQTKDGMVITKPYGQAKTGSGDYISRTLVEMAETPGYGKTAFVDARFVNRDGSPRVAPDAFTEAEAARIRKAGVRLRGVRDLDSRARDLCDDIERFRKDSSNPVDRHRLETLRDEIARAYRPGGVAMRAAGSGAFAFATAAVLTLVVQAASDGEVDLAVAGAAAGKAAAFAAGGTLVDAAVYHAGTRLGMAPEAAKGLAQGSVAAGFCLIAAGADIYAELKAARAGEISLADAVAGSAAKTALDILPLAFASLGIVGVPLLIGAQLGGRWLIGKVREAECRLQAEIADDRRYASSLHARLDRLNNEYGAICRNCDETDRIHERIMSQGTGRRALA